MGCTFTIAARGSSGVTVGEGGAATVAVAGGEATSGEAVLVGVDVIPSLVGASPGPQLTSKPMMVMMTNPNRLWLKYPPCYEIMDGLIGMRSYYTGRPHFVQVEMVTRNRRAI